MSAEEVDYTNAIEAGARALWEMEESSASISWDELPPLTQYLVRERVGDVVVAAVDAARTDWLVAAELEGLDDFLNE